MESCHLCVFDIFYATFHISVCLVLSVLTLMYFTIPENMWDMILLSGMEFFLHSTLILAAIFIALDILNRNRLIEMLRKIQQFDNQVS